MKSELYLLILCIVFLTGCSKGHPKTQRENDAELRFVGVYDCQFDNHKSLCQSVFAIIAHFNLINHGESKIFAPILRTFGDSLFCSRIETYIEKTKIDNWCTIVPSQTKCEINPHDTIRIQISILKNHLAKAGINEDMSTMELLHKLRFNYQQCLSDSVYSKYPVHDIRITHSDSIIYMYPDSENVYGERKIFYFPPSQNDKDI